MPASDPDRIRRLLDDYAEVEQILAAVTLEEFAAAYCRYSERNRAAEEYIDWEDDPDGWAPELYFDLVLVNPWTEADEERRRAFLLLIVEGAANDDVLGSIGAGPFEDFLGEDESRLAWVEKHAAASAKFRKALSNVWISSWSSEGTFLRMEAAAQAELAWPESRGPRPGTRELSHPTPEAAAVAWFLPHQTQAMPVGVRIDGDEAHVWLLTRDRPPYYLSFGDGPPMRVDQDEMSLTTDPVPFEEYEAVCARVGGLWRKVDGSVGFSSQTPGDIRERAAAMRRDAPPDLPQLSLRIPNEGENEQSDDSEER